MVVAIVAVMAESTRPGRRRGRRSTRVSQQLQEARQRNAAQLVQQRRQEEKVEEALAAFFGAGDRIAVVDEDCQRRVDPHQRAITQLRERRDEQVAELERAQGLAALAIHEADRTVRQVGELLGVGEKPARRLIAAGRKAATKAEVTGEEDTGAPPPDTMGDIRREQPRGHEDPATEASSPDGAAAETAGGRSGSTAIPGGNEAIA